MPLYLMYYLDQSGNRVYTLQHKGPDGKPTIPSHPARFSPVDPYSQERLTIKKRYNLLLTQGPPIKY